MKNKLFINIKGYLLAILFVMVLISCASKQSVLSNVRDIEVSPKLIFLNYTIKKNSNGTKNIQFINKIITDGKLKNHNKYSIESSSAGDLKCDQLDGNSNILQTEIIKNPLVKIIEYIDDFSAFQTKKIELDSASFSFRLQLKPSTKHITITDISTLNSKTEPLIKTQIN